VEYGGKEKAGMSRCGKNGAFFKGKREKEVKKRKIKLSGG
jgi:hypothetical protein